MCHGVHLCNQICVFNQLREHQSVLAAKVFTDVDSKAILITVKQQATLMQLFL